MASRAQDIVDILLETDGTPNKGWQTDPAIPDVTIEDKDNTVYGFKRNPPINGVIVIKKKYKYEGIKRGPTKENQVWTFKLVIIAHTDAKLDLMIDQAREVFDRYTDAPFATDTNTHTYDYARFMNGETEDQESSWVCDCWVQLALFNASVVIA